MVLMTVNLVDEHIDLYRIQKTCFGAFHLFRCRTTCHVISNVLKYIIRLDTNERIYFEIKQTVHTVNDGLLR